MSNEDTLVVTTFSWTPQTIKKSYYDTWIRIYSWDFFKENEILFYGKWEGTIRRGYKSSKMEGLSYCWKLEHYNVVIVNCNRR